MKIVLLLILKSALYMTIAGLKCYTCSVSQNDIDQQCIRNPNAVPGNSITNCNKLYCTTTRVEYLDPKGKIQSMNRDCVDKPIFFNQIVEDSSYRIYYTACQTDLCNGGSGTDTHNTGLINDDGAPIVLYVPGKGSSTDSSATFSCSTALFTCIAFFGILYLN